MQISLTIQRQNLIENLQNIKYSFRKKLKLMKNKLLSTNVALIYYTLMAR